MSNQVLTVGTFTRSLLIDLAQSKGKFLEVGLDIEEVSVSSSPEQFRALQEGRLDVALTSPDNALAYRFLDHNPLSTRLPVTVLSALDRGLGLTLCLSPATSDVAQLEGRTVAVDVPQSGFAFVAYALLEELGVARDAYRIESFGATPRRAQALLADRCQATVLNAGNELRAVRGGCRIVSRATDHMPYLGTVLAAMETTDDGLRERQSTFALVLGELSRELLDGQWESDFIETAIKLFGLTRAEAKAHHAIYLDERQGVVRDGFVDRESIATLVDLRRKYLPAPELDFILNNLDSFLMPTANGGD